MDEASPAGATYKQLGKQLRTLRARAKETLAEASGAVEIDVRELASFELGQARPNEEILLLLISHFGAKDDEAVKLWQLAGYDDQKSQQTQMNNGAAASKRDQKIIFTDVVDVVVNNYGVVMNFMQGSGPNSQPQPVARVGMSREHAKSVLQILQVTLNQTEQKTPKLPRRIISPDTPNPS
jgi:transcriptional regulator with XRE-family HTH domain